MEVMVVVVIIGILATISINLINAKNSAYMAAMQSDLRNAVLAQIQYFDDNQQYAPSAAQLDGFVPSANITLIFVSKPTGFTGRTMHSQRADAWCAVFMGTVNPIFSPATEEGVIVLLSEWSLA